jgi:hypothetical protein
MDAVVFRHRHAKLVWLAGVMFAHAALYFKLRFVLLFG